MTTTKKLLLGFGTLAALLLLFSVTLTIRLSAIESSLEEQGNISRPRAYETRLMEINALGFALAVRTFAQTGDGQFRDEALRKAADVERHLAEYERLASTDRHRELASGFTTRWRPLRELGETLIADDRPRSTDDWRRLAALRMDLERFLEEEIQAEARGSYIASTIATISDVRAITTLTAILLAALIIIGIVTSTVVGQSIVRTERMVHENRELLQVTLASIGDAVMTTDQKGRITFLNQVAQTLTGWTQEQAEGQPADRVFRIVNETTREVLETPVDKVLREGGIAGLANHTVLLAKDGREIPIDDSGAPIRDKAGELRGVVLVFRDIAERKQTEKNQKLLFEIAENIRQRNDIVGLLSAVADAVGGHFKVSRCLFNEIDLENDLETVYYDYCRGVGSVTGVHRITDYSEITSAEMRAGKTVVNSDSKIDPRTAALYEQTYLPAEERSYIAVPLMREGKWIASLWVSDSEPRDWTNADINLLETVAERVWLAVEKLRSDAAVRESEELFAKAFSSSPLAITVTSLTTGKLVEVNESFVNLTGYEREEAIGRTTNELGLWMRPEDRESELSKVKDVGRIRNAEYSFRMKDGREIVGLLSAELLELRGDPSALTLIHDITERKQAEKAKARLAAIVESSDDAIISKDLNSIIMSWNKAAELTFGYTAAEAIGRPVTMLIPPDRIDEEPSILERIRNGVSVDHYETVRRRKDGTEIEVSLTVSPIRDESGNIIGASKIARNVTARKAAEVSLRKSEERFSRFMVHLPGLAWIKDTSGRYVYANAAVLTAFGTTREKLYGRTDAEIFPLEVAARFRENDGRALAEHTRVQAIETLTHDDGVAHHSIVSKFPISGPDGATELVGGIAIDITDRLRAEQALRESEEKFRILSDTAPALIWFNDQNGACRYVNQRYLDFCGMKLDEIQGTGWHPILDPEQADDYLANYDAARRERRMFHHRVRIRRHDGAWRWIDSFAQPLFSPDGTYLGHVGVSPDITDLVEAEEELTRSRLDLEKVVLARTSQLAEADKSLNEENVKRLEIEKERTRLLNKIITTQEDERRRIARDLHDEMGQQLTGLRLKLKSAREMCGEPELCDEIDEIQLIAERLDADVSFLARELRPAALDQAGLPAVLAAYVKEWSRYSTIVADFHATGLAKTRLNSKTETNLYRIAQEALNNIQKHAKANNVSILLEKRRNEITLIIEDDGIAFDPNTKRNRRKGLGLIGMDERAALLGGTLEIESSKGIGTTVFVRVPASQPEMKEVSDGE